MAKGRDKHQQRKQDLSLFGKDLVRRCGSQCELCAGSGLALSIYEVPPVPNEPDYDRCVMLCDNCQEQVESPKRRDNNHWRCLNGSIWSEVPLVKSLAVVMLTRVAEQEDWAKDMLDMVYLDADEQALVDQISPEIK